MPHRAVFLDRDGVLNRALVRDGLPFSPRTEDELEILPEAPEACAALQEAGYLLIVVTNQPDVARGHLTSALLDALHARLRDALSIDEVVTCPHDDVDACSCRKPLPGMLVETARRRDIDLARSYMVGDRWRDVEAGRRAGCITVHVDHGYAEPVPVHADVIVRDLAEAARVILSASGPER